MSSLSPASTEFLASPRDSALQPIFDNRQILQWLLFLRVVVATFVLGTIFLIEHSEARYAFYTLIGIHVLTALLSALMVPRLADKNWFLMLQVYWDLFFVSGLVYISGGYFSFFLFMYVISVINAAILLKRRAAIVAAAFSALALIFLFSAQWRGSLTVPNVDFGLPPMSLRDVINKIALNVFAIFVVTYLAGFLSERSKRVSSELKKKQDDLAALQARFEHMVRSIPIGLISLDANGRVDFANQAAERILPTSDGGLNGHTLSEVLPGLPEDALGKRIKHMELRLPRGKEEAFLEIFHSPLETGSDQHTGGLLVIEDRTELKAMEEAMKRADKMAALGNLAAGIAHELRNPLASISGSVQVLYKDLKLGAVDRQLMDIVVRETERVNNLVTDFLAFARPEVSNTCLVNAKGIAEEVLKVLANEPGCREGIMIQSFLDTRLFVQIDPKALRQLLWNLSTNAVQAMPEGGRLTIRGRVRSDGVGGLEGKVVEISVIDTGVGIDEETMKSVFDPFFTTKEGGTGLGLAACHNIVEMNGGRILLQSRPGKGTTFTVLLPAAERAGDLPAQEEAN